MARQSTDVGMKPNSDGVDMKKAERERERGARERTPVRAVVFSVSFVVVTADIFPLALRLFLQPYIY